MWIVNWAEKLLHCLSEKALGNCELVGGFTNWQKWGLPLNLQVQRDSYIRAYLYMLYMCLLTWSVCTKNGSSIGRYLGGEQILRTHWTMNTGFESVNPLGNFGYLSNTSIGYCIVNIQQSLVFIVITTATMVSSCSISASSALPFFPSFYLIVKAFSIPFSFLTHFGKHTKELKVWMAVSNGKHAYDHLCLH